jgi:predicted nucleic acid-binding protein
LGTLTLPASGTVYADAQIVIYTIDKHSLYAAVCRPLWEAVRSGQVTVVSSDLILLETLVEPIRSGDTRLAADREALWAQPHSLLLPITQDILRKAARLRATISGLKTPDAIHAATALLHSCTLFLSNDTGFKRIPGLPLALLDDVLAAP